LSDARASIATPLAPDEVRILTLDSGDSATVRDVTRRVIAALTGIAPREIEIYDTPNGKPMLRNDAGIHFSISHSRDVAMVAVTRVAPVGVDIEQIRAVPNAEAIIRRFFTDEDAAIIVASDNRELRFAEAWTRAEARIKVRGATVWDSAKPDPQTVVRQLQAPDGFAAAIAAASASWTSSQHSISVAAVVPL
jgi:phosphopantetheinyl transferase